MPKEQLFPYTKGGISALLQRWLDETIRKLNSALQPRVIDLTNVSTDYELSVGETAKITITAASTALNVAVEDGVYEIDLIFDPTTFAADQTIALNPNNTTYVGLLGFLADLDSTAIATDETDTVDVNVDEHRFSGSVMMRPHHAWGRLTILGNRTSMFFKCRGRTVAGVNYKFDGSTSGDIAVPHTSLGTVLTGEACIGMAYVKRIA